MTPLKIEALPNYRIYDRTGGGVTQDIYAETLDDAIEAGREWIEDGDWERDEMETPLDCCVREIVRVPDLRSIDALPGVWGAGMVGDVVVVTVDNDAQAIIPMLPLSDVSVQPDNDGSVIVRGKLGGAVPMMIDDRATLNGETHDCSGICPAKDAPECVTGEEHDFLADFEVVGGIRENPGCCGSGHGTIKQTECCSRCGLYRTTDYGASLPSNGTQATRISYDEADEKSLAWVEEKKGA